MLAVEEVVLSAEEVVVVSAVEEVVVVLAAEEVIGDGSGGLGGDAGG